MRPSARERRRSFCRLPEIFPQQEDRRGMQTAFMAVDGADLGRAVKHVENAAAYDENLNDILKELSDAEDILNGRGPVHFRLYE